MSRHDQSLSPIIPHRPHRKQIVTVDWVWECQEEGTLVAEDGQSPSSLSLRICADVVCR